LTAKRIAYRNLKHRTIIAGIQTVGALIDSGADSHYIANTGARFLASLIVLVADRCDTKLSVLNPTERDD